MKAETLPLSRSCVAGSAGRMAGRSGLAARSQSGRRSGMPGGDIAFRVSYAIGRRKPRSPLPGTPPFGCRGPLPHRRLRQRPDSRTRHRDTQHERQRDPAEAQNHHGICKSTKRARAISRIRRPHIIFCRDPGNFRPPYASLFLLTAMLRTVARRRLQDRHGFRGGTPPRGKPPRARGSAGLAKLPARHPPARS